MQINEYSNQTSLHNNTSLVNMVETIENMNKFNQLKILKILMKDNTTVVNENQNGIHVNMSDLKDHVIKELNEFVNYVKTQEKVLDVFEQEKESLQNIYFSK
jgi:hypothetical protein|tara:strand:+ start:341 stop:646 length:306 start_codon:yes stop_codon:yes gene_type:complete